MLDKLIGELIHYTPETGALVWKARPDDMFTTKRAASVWNARYAGTLALNCDDGRGYKHGRVHRKHLFAHRAAWMIHYGEPAPDRIDHINGNAADNRICNLRGVSNVENGRNSKMSSRSSTGVTGVCWAKTHGCYVAYINGPNGREHLGRFSQIEAAIAARTAAEQKHSYHQNHGRAA